MSNPTLIKWGGSLLNHDDGESLHRLGQVIAAVREPHPPIFIVPGGGPFADLVRHYEDPLGLSQEACHFMALSAMDQYAYVLREYIPGSRTAVWGTDDLADFPGPQILLCASRLRQVSEAELPRSWDVTSDSIAAYLAKSLNASLLVMLKSADIDPRLTEPGVDAFFRQLLPMAFPVWFVNGAYPERLARLLTTGHTRGLLLPPGSPPVLSY